MYGPPIHFFPFWWLFPLFMMVLCFFFMRGRVCPMKRVIGPRPPMGETMGSSATSATEAHYSEVATKLEKRIEALEAIILEYERKNQSDD